MYKQVSETIDTTTEERQLRERALQMAGLHQNDSQNASDIVTRAEAYLVFLKAGDNDSDPRE